MAYPSTFRGVIAVFFCIIIKPYGIPFQNGQVSSQIMSSSLTPSLFQNGQVSSQIVSNFEDAPAGDGPLMVLLDIPAGGKYYLHSEATVASVKEIIESYKGGALTLSQLQ